MHLGLGQAVRSGRDHAVRFARVFRSLPVGTWTDVPMPDSQAATRTLQAGGKRYLYLVNRSAAEVQVLLPAGLAEGGMQPLGGSPALALTERGYTAKLSPYELAAWAAETAESFEKRN